MNFSFVPNQGLMVEERHVAEFDVKVNRIFYYIEEDESKKTRMEYELVAKTSDGTELPPRRVKKLNNLSYFTLWTEIMDAGLDKWERQMLLLRLQTSCKDAKQVNMYHITSNGYQTLETGKDVFVAGDYTYMSNQDGIQLEVDENVRQMKWKNKIRLADKKNANRGEEDYLMVSLGASEILFTAVLLSAIKFLFIKAGFNPAVCINLYGKTGSYKTALTQAMMYMENPSQFMCSLVNDQKKMAVKKVQQCYGFPMVLEDYHPAATGYDYKRQISMIDAVVRHIESNPKSAVVFITSEFLDGGESLQARTLQIEAQNVDLKTLTKIQQEQTMATIVMNFLDKLLGNMKDAIETIQTQYEALSRHGEQSMRIEESIVFLKITAILYGKYVDNSDKLKLKSKLDKALTLQKEKQKLHLEQLSMSEEDRVIKVVYELISDKELYKKCVYRDKALYRGDAEEMLIGNRGVFLSRKALVYGLKKHNCTGISVNRIILALSKMELLDEDRGGTHTTKIQNVRAYCILYHELKERYEELRGTGE